MALESVTNIDDLVATNPVAGDDVAEGDDHIRNIKTALLTDFPGITGAVNATQAELNENDRSAQAATDHLLMLRTYLYNGSSLPGVFDVDANITEATFESIGPTGSGATNIWTDMDNLSSDAKAVMIRIVVSFTASGGDGALIVFGRPGDATWTTNVAIRLVDLSAPDTETASMSADVMIPLDTGDSTFDLTYATSNAASVVVNIYYTGFLA